MNLWAVVQYITKYATKAPSGAKKLGEVLRDAVDEVPRPLFIGGAQEAAETLRQGSRTALGLERLARLAKRIVGLETGPLLDRFPRHRVRILQ